MNPSLVAISGTLQGTAFELEEETSLGRDETNKVRVADLLASRRHCLISRNGNQYEITDLDSMNGTIVNGIPVRKRILQHGDRIDIGDSIFLFLLTDTEPDVQSVQVNDSLVARPTTRLRVEDTIYLNPERALGSPQVAAHIVAGFSTLLQISSVTNKVRSLEVLSQKLLSLVFTAVPADRGALMVGENPDEYEAAFAFKRDGQVVSQPYLNRGIVCQVLRERLGILSNDVLENPTSGFDSGPTPATSLLVVALMAFEKALGVIYLEIHDARVRFAEDHLHLMNAVASFAAPAVEHIRHLELLENENKRLQAEIEIDHRMIGESPDMRDLYQQIAKVSQTDSTVLIRGESGTGKELVAQALHRNSARSAMPFVVVNCSALSETLLESELFGYEKGAFTGALTQKKGKLETANGGTVFLDEVGEIPPPLQSKLLRVLQEREFDRVGGTRPIRLDIRFIAATNRDLENAMKSGNFRQDLFYRLNVVTLTAPPLRERREDIPLLATYFVAKHGKKSKRRVTGLSSEARACLLNYDWPGNVRELENAIERAVALGSTDVIMAEDLPESMLDAAHESSGATTKYHDALIEAKKKILLAALEQAQGSYKEAAKLLEIHPNNLHRLLRNLRISRTRRPE